MRQVCGGNSGVVCVVAVVAAVAAASGTLWLFCCWWISLYSNEQQRGKGGDVSTVCACGVCACGGGWWMGGGSLSPKCQEGGGEGSVQHRDVVLVSGCGHRVQEVVRTGVCSVYVCLWGEGKDRKRGHALRLAGFGHVHDCWPSCWTVSTVARVLS
jgi:hypothetical protein